MGGSDLVVGGWVRFFSLGGWEGASQEAEQQLVSGQPPLANRRLPKTNKRFFQILKNTYFVHNLEKHILQFRQIQFVVKGSRPSLIVASLKQTSNNYRRFGNVHYFILILDIRCQHLGNTCQLNLYTGIGYILPTIGGYMSVWRVSSAGPNCLGPNCPPLKTEQLGPGQSGAQLSVAQLSGAQLSGAQFALNPVKHMYI